ncbi:MAG: hypothetical protein KY455_11215, partial [Euryarchaeota archaeon]|nr:hypothetical protein [Euryarchaeota archaeon]
MALTLSTVLVIAAVALGPPILFAGLVAGAKRYRKEPVWSLIVVFLWGMIFAAGISAILNLTLTDGLASRYLTSDAGRFMLLALVIAP